MASTRSLVGSLRNTCLAVASDEVKRHGIHAWKRDRLVRAGADVVIGDYRCIDALMRTLF